MLYIKKTKSCFRIV